MRHFLIFLIVFCSCTSHSGIDNQSNNDSIKSNNSVSSKTYESLDFAKTYIGNDTSLFIKVDKTIAIILYPDTTWLSEQQKKMPEDSWNEIVADHDYYQSEASTALEKVGIEVKFFHADKRYYKFIKSNKSEYCIDKSKMKDRWGLILFHVDKNPVFWSGTMIDDAIKDIYEK